VRWICGGIALTVGLLASPAQAIERQHHLGLSPTLAMLSIKDKSTLSVGGGGAVHYAYGLTDQFNLTFEGGSAVVAADQQQDFDTSPRNRPARVDHGAIGAGYVIDILQWVPYIGLAGGLYHLSGGTMQDALFVGGISLAAGLDYQITRHVAAGIGVREHLLLSKLETYPSYTTFVLRLEYMWGY
jgi:hypothetical protein